MTDTVQIHGNFSQGQNFIDSITNGKFLFSLALSYTETCEIPGITIAGSNKDLIKYTPAADAEYLHFGYCKSIKKIPMTPDGKPTPALLTKTALECSSIPHVIINAGSRIPPLLPFFHTGLSYGHDISKESAMSYSDVLHAVECGRIIGRTLSSLTDCLIIGESIPGGTTTALAVLRGLGFKAQVSSSMPNNPTELKNNVVESALRRIDSDNPYSIVSQVGDPMIPFVAGMVSSASAITRVLLSGGTQMLAVLAFASKIGFHAEYTAIGTTSYIVHDVSANFIEILREIADIPTLSIDPKLVNSKFDGLKAYSYGFAKEGVGAGGSMIASVLRTKISSDKLLELIEKEYQQNFTLQ